MKSILRIIKAEKAFLIPTVIMWGVCVVLILSFSKPDLHLWVNQYHSRGLDAFFRTITNLGGSVPFYIAAVFLLVRFRYTLLLLLTQALSALVTHPIKHIMKMPRPLKYFKELGIDLPLVDGVHYHSSLSFPSGHSTAAFAMCFSLAFLVKSPVLKVFFFVLAVLTAYSRVYLSQHFVEDVFAGSVVAVITAFPIFILYQKMNNSWLDKSLITVWKKK